MCWNNICFFGLSYNLVILFIIFFIILLTFKKILLLSKSTLKLLYVCIKAVFTKAEDARLTFLPEEYPEVLIKDPHVKELLPKMGDEMVADWLKEHLASGTLVGCLQNRKKTDRVRCCLYFPNHHSERILLFTRLHEVTDGEQNAAKSSNTKEVINFTTNSINRQLHKLKRHFAENGITMNNLEISCFLCVGTKSQNSEVLDLLPKMFANIENNLQGSFKKLEFDEVLFCSENEKIQQQSSEVIQAKMDAATERKSASELKNYIGRFVPEAYGIAVTDESYRMKSDSTCLQNLLGKYLSESFHKIFPKSSRIKLDSTGVRNFLRKRLSERTEKVITLPDFDRIKCTKLFPVVKDEKKEKNKKSNSLATPDWKIAAMTEDRGMYAYIGEIELFWPHFNEKWFPSAKGVLMHSFCNAALGIILQDKIKFNFEFDWIYWSTNHVILFEVGMMKRDPDGKVKSEKIAEKIEEKMNKAFKQYIPVLKILFYYMAVSSQTSEQFESLIHRYFSVVLFLPSVEHNALKHEVEKYIQSRENAGHFTKEERKTLAMIYFVGRSTSTESNGYFFYKYNVKAEKITTIRTDTLLKTHAPAADRNEAARFEEMLGLFSMTYFLDDYKKDSNIIGNFEQGPGSLLERYIDAQKKFIDKVHELEGDRKNLLKLDVLLSPQQLGIILEDEKYVRCVGESGSGKTEILLSKAFISSLNNDVKYVYFCIPKEVTSEMPLMKMVKKYKEDKKIHKMQILAGDAIYDVLKQLKQTELPKTVILLDEFQDRCGKFTAVPQGKFLELSRQIFPYLKNCWIASATLKSSNKMRKKFPNYVLYEPFCMRPMNITFRSAVHIAEFCNKLVTNGSSKFFFQTSRVRGVFTSKQTSVVVNIIERTSEEATNYIPPQYPNATSDLDSSYEQNRWFIVFCSAANKHQWSTKLEMIYEISKKSDKCKLFVVDLKEGPAGCDFSGGEAHSVIIYLDGPETRLDELDKEIHDSFVSMLLMACSRAQYELVIYVRNDLASINSLLQQCRRRPEGSVKIEDLLQKLRESIEQGTDSWTKLLTDDNGIIPYILSTIDHDVIPPTVIRKLGQCLHIDELSTFLNGQDNRFILLYFGKRKAFPLLTLLLRGPKTTNYESYRSCIRWCLQVGYKNMMEWLVNLIEMRQIQGEVELEKTLPIVCFRPKLMKRWLQKLEEWNKLQNGLKSYMRFDTGEVNGECGFVTLLTFANVDFANEELDCYNELQKLISKTPSRYLFDRLFNKTALHYAINHGNAKSIKYILNQPQWQQWLWEQKEIEHFQMKCFLETAIYLKLSKSVPCLKSMAHKMLFPRNSSWETELVLPSYEKPDLEDIKSSCYLERFKYVKRRGSLPCVKFSE